MTTMMYLPIVDSIRHLTLGRGLRILVNALILSRNRDGLRDLLPDTG